MADVVAQLLIQVGTKEAVAEITKLNGAINQTVNITYKMAKAQKDASDTLKKSKKDFTDLFSNLLNARSGVEGLIGGFLRLGTGAYLIGRALQTVVATASAIPIAFYKAGASYEKFSLTLQALTGSVSESIIALSQLQELSRTRGLDLVVAQDTISRLKGFGVETEKLVPLMTRFAIATKGDAEAMSRLALVFGQIKQQGRAYGDDLRQIFNTGVPIARELADVLDVPAARLRAMAKEGAITSEVMEKALANITAKGTELANLFDTLAEGSASGRWGRAFTAFGQWMQSVGIGFAQGTKGIAQATEAVFTEAMQKQQLRNLLDTFAELQKGLAGQRQAYGMEKLTPAGVIDLNTLGTYNIPEALKAASLDVTTAQADFEKAMRNEAKSKGFGSAYGPKEFRKYERAEDIPIAELQALFEARGAFAAPNSLYGFDLYQRYDAYQRAQYNKKEVELLLKRVKDAADEAEKRRKDEEDLLGAGGVPGAETEAFDRIVAKLRQDAFAARQERAGNPAFNLRKAIQDAVTAATSAASASPDVAARYGYGYYQSLWGIGEEELTLTAEDPLRKGLAGKSNGSLFYEYDALVRDLADLKDGVLKKDFPTETDYAKAKDVLLRASGAGIITFAEAGIILEALMKKMAPELLVPTESGVYLGNATAIGMFTSPSGPLPESSVLGRAAKLSGEGFGGTAWFARQAMAEKGVGGISTTSEMQMAKLMATLTTSTSNMFQEAGVDYLVQVFKDIGTGENIVDSLVNSMQDLASNLGPMFIQAGLSAIAYGRWEIGIALLGMGGVSTILGAASAASDPTHVGLSGDPVFNALGNAYASPSLSAYSGGIYNTPHLFAFAKGAGVFGEAGYEAIMPLTRTATGQLGVRAQGGNTVVQIIDQSSGKIAIATQESTQPDGSKLFRATIRDMVRAEMANTSIRQQGIRRTV